MLKELQSGKSEVEALLTVDAVHATRIFWYSSIKSVPISYFVPQTSFLDHTWVI
ncbi:hypothetical protein [Bacillus salipaludis]|uniref:hypothetical protein n=1 Tax=Bacillus salipaludis TaxID=2547811 RepID=UPI002E217CC6|nr:hypothetical protein [Bacillus salipaludis]